MPHQCNQQPRRMDWNVHVLTMMTSLHQSVRPVDTVEWACVLCGIMFKMNEGIQQRICIKFCIRLEPSSVKTIGMVQKATAMGNWWLAALSRQCARSCITSPAEFFEKHQITQVTQHLYRPELAPCNLRLFPKLKSLLKEKRFQTINKIQENITGQLMMIGRTV